MDLYPCSASELKALGYKVSKWVTPPFTVTGFSHSKLERFLL